MSSQAAPLIQELLDIMTRLRDPDTGCAWDIEQSFETIIPYTIEEAYEVSDAIQREDYYDLKDELGDLLLQVVFHSRIAEEKQLFNFNDVVKAICDKMIRRHPHVFGDIKIDPKDLPKLWETIKSQEKELKYQNLEFYDSTRAANKASVLSSIPNGLPSLLKAEKISKKAAQVGFDWGNSSQVIDKIKEELLEVENAVKSTIKDEIQSEIGDLLFSVVNLARFLGISPEMALQKTNEKFRSRFQYIEQSLQEKGKDIENSSLDEMESLWNKAKEKSKISAEGENL